MATGIPLVEKFVACFAPIPCLVEGRNYATTFKNSPYRPGCELMK